MSRDNSIRIGGNAPGPVVAGDNNRVEMRTAKEPQPSGPTQNNTAENGGTIFAVMNGNQDVTKDEEGPEHPQPN
jgi:hypothetical protein